MKAKEYAKKYFEDTNQLCNNGHKQEEAERIAISGVLIGLSNELLTLIKNRGKCTFEAALSCFDEIEKKWRAFTYLVPGWKADGFIWFIQNKFPDLWTLYQLGKQESRHNYSVGR